MICIIFNVPNKCGGKHLWKLLGIWESGCDVAGPDADEAKQAESICKA